MGVGVRHDKFFGDRRHDRKLAILRKLQKIAAGMADSGFAAAANFAVGIIAVRMLGVHELAAYSLFFSGWITTQILPAQIAYMPSRIDQNKNPAGILPSFRHDGRRALRISLLAAVLASLAALPLAGSLTAFQYVGGALAVATLTVVSPFQDHLRRALHVAGRHATATATSAATFLTTSTLVTAATLTTDVEIWMLFAALATGNGLGAAIGVLLSRGTPRRVSKRMHFRRRVAFVGSDFALQASGYLISVITAGIVGAHGLAALEVARIVSSPIVVLITGLASVLVPRLLRSFSGIDRAAYRRHLLAVPTSVLTVGAIYLGTVALSSPLLAVALGPNFETSVAVARSAVATTDSLAMGAAMVLFTAGPRATASWNKLSLAVAVLAVALALPLAHVAGVLGVLLAQGVSATLRSVTAIRWALAAESEGEPDRS